MADNQQFDPQSYDNAPNGVVGLAASADIALVPTLLAHDASIGTAADKASTLIMEAVSMLSAPGRATATADPAAFQAESEQVRRMLVAAVMFALLWANNHVFVARILGKSSRLAYLLDISGMLYRVISILMPSGSIIPPGDEGRKL